MLNEKVEFEEYYEKLKFTDKPRLITSLFFKEDKGKKGIKCSGITRALVILARHYLFHNEKNYYDLNKEQREALREDVRDKLKQWCFSEEGVLYKYFENNKKTECWQNYKSSKEKVWNSTNVYTFLNAISSYEHAINFSIIIAEAIYEGPLKVRYLKIKKGFEQEVYYQTKTMREKAKENDEDIKQAVKPLAKSSEKEVVVTGKCEDYRDMFLKQICAYLVKKDKSSEFLYINSIDLANWMGIKSFASNSDDEQVKFFYSTKGLYTYKNKKQCINSSIIEELEIDLINEEEYNALKEQNDSKYVVFEDTGAGTKSLIKV